MDIARRIDERAEENFDLHRALVNPALARVLHIISYDNLYARADGATLYDRGRRRYLDFLGGFGIYQLGRSHPEVKRALHELIDLDRPNLIQMDCPLLAGLLAERLTERAQRDYPGLDTVFSTNWRWGRGWRRSR
jgi:ornithine--oxo-acid transaminase